MTRAFNMDCKIAMKEFDDKFFDLGVLDPPFGIDDMLKNSNGRHRNKITTYRNKSIPCEEYFREVERVCRQTIIWGCQYYLQFMSPGGSFVVWDKLKDPDTCNMSSCDIAWNSKKQRIRTFKGVWNGALKIDNEQTIHPHQKPVALYKWTLNHYAKPGYKILDTHLGSGSSRIAAHDMGFDFWGYELDKDYFEAQEKRFAQHISQLKIFNPAPHEKAQL